MHDSVFRNTFKITWAIQLTLIFLPLFLTI